jgi:hypothetical protein
MIATLVFLICALTSYSQQSHEQEILYLSTENNESLTLSLDTLKNSLVFRFLIDFKPELVVTDDLNDSIPVFEYYYYLRGGGAENAGLDLNYIRFTVDDIDYEIYYEYSAEDDSTGLGFKDGGSDYPCSLNTMRGHFIEFRFNGLMPVHWI